MTSITLEPMIPLARDMRRATTTMTVAEARYLVDLYYAIQDSRIGACNQQRALGEAGEPHEIFGWVFANMNRLENSIRSALDIYSDGSELGRWCKSICGIGPVIAAGLLAHIDITMAPTVGHIWRFAGLDPTSRWGKGEKRPWNADLKVLCWKVGESFVKVQNNPSDIYGHVYADRKVLEIERNEAGLFAEQAAAALAMKRIGKDTEAHKWYSRGKLPPAHIHARAKRYAVKLFLAHLHHVAYELEYGVPPPKPYVIEHGGHTHFVSPPNWPM